MPYGNSRTAGSGVAYVRAKLLPKKELVVEPVMEEIKAQEESKEASAETKSEPAPVLEAEEIFSEAQHKGTISEQAAPVEDDLQSALEKEEHSLLNALDALDADESYDRIKSAEEAEAVNENDEASYDALTPMPELEEKHSSLMYDLEDSMSTEDYIAQAPKRIIAPKVEVIKVSSYTQENEVKISKKADVDDAGLNEDIYVYENEIVQPNMQIIVPKKDMMAYLSVGEEELSEIYNQPF